MRKRAGTLQVVGCMAALGMTALALAALGGCTLLAGAQTMSNSQPPGDAKALASNGATAPLSHPNPAAIVPAAASPAAVKPIAGSVTNALVPSANPSYTVGSGDLLSISVWKEKELSPTVIVRPDGKISMPLIGELSILGMTPVEVEKLLREQLEAIVVNPRVTVTVVEIHSRMVYITGEVSRPGAYPLNGPLGVLQLIAQAGGLTEFAARKKICIVKANSTSKNTPFDYNRVVRSGDPNRNLSLAPGDTVVVP